MGNSGKERILIVERKTMKDYLLVILSFILICVTLLSQTIEAFDLSNKEKALEALKTKDYNKAISISLQQLESAPDNYDFNFILSRAYAYSGHWDKALEILDKMLVLHPENTDIILFHSRIHARKGKFAEAETGFKKALALDPNNIEALIGVAEVNSWSKDLGNAIAIYQKILQFDPDNPEIYFRIGRVYLWDGNYSKARQYYKKACELDPDNIEYRRALKGAHPDFVDNYELRYQYQNQGFSDKRGNYIDHHLVFSIKISPDIGSLHLKYNQTQRYGEQDSQFGIELYPHLWQKAYGYVDLNFSPEAVHYPSTSYLFEVYQSFLQAAEISLGYRRMNFESDSVSVYLGSVGYYVGNYYPFMRWYYTPEDEGNNFSWFVNVRRYFTKDSYLALGYGQGSKSFDIITIEDVLVRKSWIFMAEWDWFFLKRIRVKIQFTHRNEKNGPTRNTLFVATGYRW